MIDIDIVITPENLEVTKEALLAAGYIWIGDSGITGRVCSLFPSLIFQISLI